MLNMVPFSEEFENTEVIQSMFLFRMLTVWMSLLHTFTKKWFGEYSNIDYTLFPVQYYFFCSSYLYLHKNTFIAANMSPFSVQIASLLEDVFWIQCIELSRETLVSDKHYKLSILTSCKYPSSWPSNNADSSNCSIELMGFLDLNLFSNSY